MHPFCLDQSVGVIPWSPQARGLLTRPWNEETSRSRTDDFGATLYHQHENADRAIIDAVARIAASRGVSMAQIALAWVRSQPAVTAPIVGMTKPGHLDDALASLSITLTDEELDALESPYLSQNPEGF